MSLITTFDQHQDVTLDHIPLGTSNNLGVHDIPDDAPIGSVWYLIGDGFCVVTEQGAVNASTDILGIKQSPRLNQVLDWAERKIGEEIEYQTLLETNPLIKKMHDELQFAIKLHKGIED